MKRLIWDVSRQAPSKIVLTIRDHESVARLIQSDQSQGPFKVKSGEKDLSDLKYHSYMVSGLLNPNPVPGLPNYVRVKVRSTPNQGKRTELTKTSLLSR